MKRNFSKFLGVGLALALVVSFSLVPGAGLVGAQSHYIGVKLVEEDKGDGEDSESIAQWVEDSTRSGNYAVELDTDLPLSEGTVDAAIVLLPYNQALSTITELGYSFKQLVRDGYRQDDAAPYMVLALDTDANDTADLWVIHHMFWTEIFDETVWETWALSDGPIDISKMASGAIVSETAYMWHVAGAGATEFEWAEDADHVQWAEVVTELGTATILNVQVAMGQWTSDKREAHNIDDVIINSTTYDLEPMVFDAEYYSIGETVDVTVCNGNVNADPMAIEEITIAAKSTTDDSPGDDSVTLTETGADTGVFTGSITLIGAAPAIRANDEIVVAAEDTVTVTYTDGNWGAGTQTIVLEADVDDTGPTITIIEPADTDNITVNTPDIEATLTDDGSGIDEDTIVMKLDTVTATAAYNSGTGALTYTPSALDDGSHAVTVDVSDLAGNAATQLSWSFTVDTVVPVITLQVATPPVILPDDETPVVFTATVIDATSGVATVTINLSPVGGTAVDMLDDGEGDDATADDGIYTASANITEADELDYDLTVTATDEATKEATAVISLGVWEDIVDPVITDPAIIYTYESSVRPSETVTISANVTDDILMDTVTAACAEFTTVDLLDDGNTPDTDADDNIYTGTATVASDAAAGNYTITITATDDKGNDATDTSLSLTVDPAAFGSDITLADGWNLISLPLIPTDGSIDVVLADISDNVIQVRTWVYEAGVLTEEVWINDGPADFTVMAAGQGYWIEMTEADELAATGVELPAPPQAPPSYSVYEGWNLVGFKSLSASTAEAYLGGAVTLTFEAMYGYDAAGGVYAVIQLDTNLEPGQGYWLAVSADGTIYP